MKSAVVLLSISAATIFFLIFSSVSIADENNFWVKCDISDASHIGQCYPSKDNPITTVREDICYKNQWAVVDGATKYCCWSWNKDKSSSEPKWTDKCDVSASISVDKATGKSSDPFVFTLTANPYPSESNGYQAELQYVVSGENTWKTCGVKTVVDSTPWSVAVTPGSSAWCTGLKTLTTGGKYLFDFRVYITEPAQSGKYTNKVTLTLDDMAPTTNAVCTTDFSSNNPIYSQCSTGWYKNFVKAKLTCDDGTGTGCDKIYSCSTKDCVPTQYYDVKNEQYNSFYSEGANYLNYYSVDKVGNIESTKTLKVNIDTKNPTITVTGAPSEWTNQDKQATASCTDVGSGCDTNSYKFKIIDYSGNENFNACPTDYASYTLASPQTISDHKWVCAAGKDVSGNIGYSNPANFMVDKIKPINPTMTDPGLYSNTGSVGWSWTVATDNAGGSGVKNYIIHVSSPGSSDFGNRVEYETTSNSFNSVGLLEGKIYSRVRAKDNAGNIGDWSTVVSTIVDKTPPPTGTYKINDKSSSTVFTKGSLTHTWSGFNDDTSKTKDVSGLYSFEIWRAPDNANNCNNGNTAGCAWSLINKDMKSPSFGSWSETVSSSYMYGWHSSDNAGNFIHESAPIEVIYDVTPPTTSILCNNENCISDSSWYRVPVTLTLNCNDGIGSGCSETSTSYNLDGSGVATYNANSKPVVSSDKKHSVDYYSVDKVGNTETSKNQKINVDQTAPSVSVSYVPRSISTIDEIVFTATASDATSGLSTVAISIDGSLKKVCNYNGDTSQQTCSYSVLASSIGAGSHTLSSTATDKAGNSKTSSITDGSDGGFVVESCNFGPVGVSPSCSLGYSSNCEPGDQVSVTATYSGKCPSTAYIQVDMSTGQTGNCDIVDQGRSQCDTDPNKITGINVQCTKSVCTGIWTIPDVPDNCKGKIVSATASSIRDDYPCAGGKTYNTAAATGSMKFFSENECNNPGVCDFPYEKQTNCPGDCKTTITANPRSVYPGTEVELTIQFEDGRYNLGHDVSFELLINPGISQIVWDKSNGCFSGERFSVTNSGGNITQAGKAKIITKCKMPSSIAIGVNTLQATPTFYSDVVRLNPAITTIIVNQIKNGNNFFEILNDYITRFLAGSPI